MSKCPPCTTHHHACRCREYILRKALESALFDLKVIAHSDIAIHVADQIDHAWEQLYGFKLSHRINYEPQSGKSV